MKTLFLIVFLFSISLNSRSQIFTEKELWNCVYHCEEESEYFSALDKICQTGSELARCLLVLSIFEKDETKSNCSPYQKFGSTIDQRIKSAELLNKYFYPEVEKFGTDRWLFDLDQARKKEENECIFNCD